ncbi:MAG TPA: SprT-like domain-containing protein [Candidatus Binatia bacterium]|nr:SprT-like domain-containing protein [Candidatus Binatia bacterium]
MEERAHNYAWRLLEKYRLEGWIVAIEPIPSLESGERVLGQCQFHIQSIILDCDLIHFGDWRLISDVIRHEIAHALVETPGHGPRWQRKAREVGVSEKNIARYVKF